jgi:Pyruvate phosphate dikinase, AMP/ATP-binding domain
MTVADGAGTLETETPAGLRSTPVLSPAQAGELGRVGLSIGKLYGEPVDVEWARAGAELWVVQARPITARAARPAVSAGGGDQWNDSLARDYLWTNGNLGEALPDVMTPATWSFIELFMGRMIFPPSVPGYPATPTRCWPGSRRPAPRPGSGWHAATRGRRRRRVSSSCAGRRSPAAARRPDPRSSGRCG